MHLSIELNAFLNTLFYFIGHFLQRSARILIYVIRVFVEHADDYIGVKLELLAPAYGHGRNRPRRPTLLWMSHYTTLAPWWCSSASVFKLIYISLLSEDLHFTAIHSVRPFQIVHRFNSWFSFSFLCFKVSFCSLNNAWSALTRVINVPGYPREARFEVERLFRSSRVLEFIAAQNSLHISLN